MAADSITPEAINFMAVHGRGLICLALSTEICDALHLPLISAKNTSRFGTAFCESIDAAEGVTTGIPRRIARTRFASRCGKMRVRRIWRVPGTCFPCEPGQAACWCARDKPRRPSIWRRCAACGRAA